MNGKAWAELICLYDPSFTNEAIFIIRQLTKQENSKP